MTSFTSLLSSISGQPSTPQPKQSTAPKPSNGVSSTVRPSALPNGTKPAVPAGPATTNTVAGVKRKPEEQITPARVKVVKTEVNVPVRPAGQSNPRTNADKPNAPSAASGISYRGTARPSGAANPVKPVPKPIPKPAANGNASSSANVPAADGGLKRKRGFASIMEKAKAAQEAVKAAGSSTIKHKPVEKLTKRDRLRMQEEAKQKGSGKSGKSGKSAVTDRSRSGTPIDGKPGLQRQVSESAYKGTMNKKPVVRQEFTYKGTMNRAGSGVLSTKPAAKKNNAGRHKYSNDYVDWDDLDDAEDEEEEEEEQYDSEGSEDMMDAGFDDMEREEQQALKVAKKEDQEALEEEERHRREKLERKRKLQALSKKSAAAKKRF